MKGDIDTLRKSIQLGIYTLDDVEALVTELREKDPLGCQRRIPMGSVQDAAFGYVRMNHVKTPEMS